MKKKYSKHLYQPIRREIINSYIKHELIRLLPSTNPEKIYTDVDKWFKDLLFRDYWNGVHGIAMGFRLQHHFIHTITAENIKWEKKNYPLDQNIVTGIELRSIISLPDKRMNAKNIDVLIHRHKSKFDKWHDSYKKNLLPNTGVNKFPIIAVQEKVNKKTVYSIHDGNNRFVEAIYLGQKSIPAYLGTYTTKEFVPQNFWLPTSFLMDLVYNAKLADDPEDLTRLLKKLIKLSESGKHELMERVLIGESKHRKKIKKYLE